MTTEVRKPRVKTRTIRDGFGKHSTKEEKRRTNQARDVKETTAKVRDDTKVWGPMAKSGEYEKVFERQPRN